MATGIAIYALHLVILIVGVLSFCGAILLLIGNSGLEKANAFFNKVLFSIGPSFKKGDENIINIDNWLMKRSRLVGVVALIITILIIVNLYTRII